MYIYYTENWSQFNFRLKETYIVNILQGKNGLHMSGNNSTKSEWICMKSETFVSQMWGLALADVGRHLRSSDSLRRIVFPKKKCKKMLTKFLGLAT